MGRATFNEPHNWRKTQALLVLQAHLQDGGSGVTLHELAVLSLVHEIYLSSRLGYWVRWHYIDRRLVQGAYRRIYLYTIAPKGSRFVLWTVPLRLRDKLVARIETAYNSRMARDRLLSRKRM